MLTQTASKSRSKAVLHYVPSLSNSVDEPQVAAMLALDQLSNQYTVELDPDSALAFVAQADTYNEFSQKDLIGLIQDTCAVIPAMNYPSDNPNNGLPHHRYRVGNEYSRVIYLVVYKVYLPDSFDYVRLAKRLGTIGRKYHANEYDAENGDREFSYRFWWD